MIERIKQNNAETKKMGKVNDEFSSVIGFTGNLACICSLSFSVIKYNKTKRTPKQTEREIEKLTNKNKNNDKIKLKKQKQNKYSVKNIYKPKNKVGKEKQHNYKNIGIIQNTYKLCFYV